MASAQETTGFRGEFNIPHDVKFDTAGNMYVAEYDNATECHSNGRAERSHSYDHLVQVLSREITAWAIDPLAIPA